MSRLPPFFFIARGSASRYIGYHMPFFTVEYIVECAASSCRIAYARRFLASLQSTAAACTPSRAKEALSPPRSLPPTRAGHEGTQRGGIFLSRLCLDWESAPIPHHPLPPKSDYGERVVVENTPCPTRGGVPHHKRDNIYFFSSSAVPFAPRRGCFSWVVLCVRTYTRSSTTYYVERPRWDQQSLSAAEKIRERISNKRSVVQKGKKEMYRGSRAIARLHLGGKRSHSISRSASASVLGVWGVGEPSRKGDEGENGGKFHKRRLYIAQCYH